MKTTTTKSISSNKIFLLIMLFTLTLFYKGYAMQTDKRQDVAITQNKIKNASTIQKLPVILGFVIIDTINPEKYSNKRNVYFNQTYVYQKENKKIITPMKSFYTKLDKNLRDMYKKEDIKLIPEMFVRTEPTNNLQFNYLIGFESKLPLKYQFATQQFEGKMKFFLLSDSRQKGSVSFEPVSIEVVSNSIESINPELIEIDHISIPLTELSLKAKPTDVMDSVQVKLITRSNPVGYETFLQIEPAILIDSTRTKLQGLGVQKIPITVKIVGSSSLDSVAISFNVKKGTVEPKKIYVHYNEPATIYVRSEGLGETILSATSQIRANQITLNYQFPYIFILMAILGGILGGMVKFFTNPGKLALFNATLRGILLGFFGAVVYYVLGYSLIKFEVSDIFNEFAVLGFSALVAYFGIFLSSEQHNH